MCRCMQAVYYTQRLIECVITCVNVWKCEQAFASMDVDERESLAHTLNVEPRKISSLHLSKHVVLGHIRKGIYIQS